MLMALGFPMVGIDCKIMKKIIEKILIEYDEASNSVFASHPLANVIRQDLKASVQDNLGEYGNGLIVDSSPGAGNWANVPWSVVLDPVVTTSATKGYYVGYLFSAKNQEVHLTLNQGATAVKEEFGRKALDVLRDRAAIMRARLAEYQKILPEISISLGYKTYLPKAYEAGHAIGKTYKLGSIPDDLTLRADLQSIVKAYLALTFRGGMAPSNEIDDFDAGKTLIEIRRYQLHQRIERNAKEVKKVKQTLGYTCQACGFSFQQKYGEIGHEFIEAHHLRPLHTLEEGIPVSYDISADFAVLCSNCHSMIHKLEDPSDLDALKQLITVKS